jgi:hypothetical protein
MKDSSHRLCCSQCAAVPTSSLCAPVVVGATIRQDRLARRPLNQEPQLRSSLRVTASTPCNATSGSSGCPGWLTGCGSCVASSRLPFHGYQFINLDTKEPDPGAVLSIFRGLALHNISGEGPSPQLEEKPTCVMAWIPLRHGGGCWAKRLRDDDYMVRTVDSYPQQVGRLRRGHEMSPRTVCRTSHVHRGCNIPKVLADDTGVSRRHRRELEPTATGPRLIGSQIRNTPANDVKQSYVGDTSTISTESNAMRARGVVTCFSALF